MSNPGQLSPKSLALVLNEEGVDQPYILQPDDSGVTIGYGDDLQFKSIEEFRGDWIGRLHPTVVTRLEAAVGKNHREAAALCPTFKDIRITHDEALGQFTECAVPRQFVKTRTAFGAGFDRLPADAKGALVSVVFNRGPGMTGPRRVEMRAIVELLRHFEEGEADEKTTLLGIYHQVLSMRRLWPEGGDLYRRRQAEAWLIKTAADAVTT